MDQKLGLGRLLWTSSTNCVGFVFRAIASRKIEFKLGCCWPVSQKEMKFFDSPDLMDNPPWVRPSCLRRLRSTSPKASSIVSWLNLCTHCFIPIIIGQISHYNVFFAKDRHRRVATHFFEFEFKAEKVGKPFAYCLLFRIPKNGLSLWFQSKALGFNLFLN